MCIDCESILVMKESEQFELPGLDGVELPEEMRLGVDLLDCQHQYLFSQLAAFQKWGTRSISSEIASELFHLIGKTLLDHFQDEEAFMKEISMPGAELNAHIEDHTRIINEYVYLQDLTFLAPNMKIYEFLDPIENWITTHLVNFDLHIRDYL